MGFRRIVVATDFSDSSKFAVRYAVALAKRLGSRLTVLHVCEPIVAGDLYGSVEAMALTREKEKAARRELASQVARIAARGVQAKGAVELGLALDVILERAETASVLVMGTHGRSGFSRMFMGSVAEKVVRSASCPVLVVRTPAPEHKRRRTRGS
jgi:universal stress protein A